MIIQTSAHILQFKQGNAERGIPSYVTYWGQIWTLYVYMTHAENGKLNMHIYINYFFRNLPKHSVTGNTFNIVFRTSK